LSLTCVEVGVKKHCKTRKDNINNTAFSTKFQNNKSPLKILNKQYLRLSKFQNKMK